MAGKAHTTQLVCGDAPITETGRSWIVKMRVKARCSCSSLKLTAASSRAGRQLAGALGGARSHRVGLIAQQ